ncbi:hypothetical protein MUN82_00195 [Hymenobacter aerilatus]|uniref:Uncharacterized protein n=1 Tax=Hymenobacter aerilatus TaxID=2932251 RepID=A0A8T9SUI4_9BACT|nr:hypothetical protein [Hymenobacter aerilatus]UOR05535.1 hypothetical protein MUN82_00195 [Hymenobacter aerilatus]
MNKILMLAGLLLCSAPVLAQSPTKTTPAPAPEGKVAVPVSPVLPGEESLTARERVERDMLMPTRRSRAAALQTAEEVEETTTTTPEVHGPAVPEAVPTAPAPEAKPAAPVRRTTYHRRRSSSAHRSTARKKTTARKPVTRHTTTRRRR